MKKYAMAIIGAFLLVQLVIAGQGIDNLFITGNTIKSVDTDGDINLTPNGTGEVVVGGDLTVHSQTPTSAQWGYLGALDQALATTDNAQFTNLTATGPVDMGDGDGDTTHTISGVSVDSSLELHSSGGSDPGGLAIHRHADTTALGGHILSLKSRGTHASPTVVQSGDVITRIISTGFDGTDYEQLSEIRSSVDGTPGAGDMPGRIGLWTTPDGTSVPVEALRVDSGQNTNILSQKELRFQDTTGGEYMGFKAPTAVTSSTTLTLPDGDGTSGQILSTNGSGTLSWASDAGEEIPPGTLTWYAGTSAPTGWLLGDGSLISRSTYSALYTVVADAFGDGDGSTTFELPDCEGRFIRGVDNASGRDPNAGTRTIMADGGNTGDNVGSIQAEDLKSHQHQQTAVTTSTDVTAGTWTRGIFSAGSNNSNNYTVGTGGSETRPINFYMNCIIKY